MSSDDSQPLKEPQRPAPDPTEETGKALDGEPRRPKADDLVQVDEGDYGGD